MEPFPFPLSNLYEQKGKGMSDLNKLIFIYNAKSGKFNAFLDTIHKKVSPSTYECNLCLITFGNFTELPDWRQFRESYPGDMEFLHIDEFEQQYEPREAYPVVLSQDAAGSLNTVLSTESLNAMRDLEQLIQYFRDWARLAA